MGTRQTLPMGEPVLLYTDQGPLCGLVLQRDQETLGVLVFFQQGGLPPQERLGVAGIFVEISRQAVLGWAPLQPLGEGEDDLWSLALESHCGVAQRKTFTAPDK